MSPQIAVGSELAQSREELASYLLHVLPAITDAVVRGILLKDRPEQEDDKRELFLHRRRCKLHSAIIAFGVTGMSACAE